MKPHSPKPTLFPSPTFGKIPEAVRRFNETRSQMAGLESQVAQQRDSAWLAQFVELRITADGRTYTVLARPNVEDGEAADGTVTPWQIRKLDGRVIRIWPNAIWDGKGNSVWATYQGQPSIAESTFDVELARVPTQGFVWLECAVTDTDDYHGIINSAAIKHGAQSTFLTKQGSLVNIPLCSYFVSVSGLTVTIDPKIAFVFTLRRFGPPTSITWDITPR
jgi:hypothetical protein